VIAPYSDEELRTQLRVHENPITELSGDENWWHIGIIDISKKHPLYRAGFGSQIVASTQFVLQPFQIDQVSGCGIVLLTGGKEPRHFAGWVPAARVPDARRWTDTLNGVIRTVLQQTPNATTETQIAALRFESGNENAPDDPFGCETIELTEAGALSYERRRHAMHVSLVGSVDPQRFQQIISSLRATTFPTRPQTRFVPGASVVKIITMPSEQSVSVDYFEALRMDGYRDVVRDLSNLAEGLRDSKETVLSAWKFVIAC
jgi:hypothetical protein